MSDELKSAVELAMERFGAQDTDVAPLSDDQKAEIAEIRARYRARIAQAEITHQTDIQEVIAGGDAAAAETLNEQLRLEKRRFLERMEREVAKVKKGSDEVEGSRKG